ncbi:helix-turn-helix domain-containing protein [Mycobacterium sp. 663a-19]|uniref:helix-turn-helix domain-containing protein n=1 Tax=Mycobacterium sp. 663a-19 TaxID=2986148 RepID=UPI002D1EA760|nr:helix-turn-helix domain-containing protein [Mycobacterium sp. 663a-19]MEB3982118.1 helix-turn-helix domain-containing protein [Mycobacterium sp. 663a-19]
MPTPTMTSITETPAPGPAMSPAGDVNAIHVDLHAVNHARARDPGGMHGPAAIRYEQFRTSEPDAARRFFADAYRPGWQVTGLVRGSAVVHRRCETGSMTFDEVMVQGRMVCKVPPADSVLVIQPRAGSLTVTGGPLPIADCPLLVAHGMSCVMQVNAARFDVVGIGADVLHKVAADRLTPLPQHIQFLSWRPRSRAAVRAWHRALDYVTATFASADTAQQPLLAAAAAPLLATALLECYPSNVTAQQDLLSDPAVPDTLKDAVKFIHRNAAGDVGVADVAAAVHLTPRAVQYLFRQRLDTTPTEYLRRVRLHRAHQELTSGDRTATTVTEVAQRWGFAHTGRFAVLYRQAYGQSPHTTLKQ